MDTPPPTPPPPPHPHPLPTHPQVLPSLNFISTAQAQALQAKWEVLPKKSSNPEIALANQQQYRADKVKFEEYKLLSSMFTTPSPVPRPILSDEDWRAGLPAIETHDWAASAVRDEAGAEAKFFSGGMSPVPMASDAEKEAMMTALGYDATNWKEHDQVKHLLQVRRGVHYTRQMYLDMDKPATAPAMWYANRPKRAPLTPKEFLLRDHGDHIVTNNPPMIGNVPNTRIAIPNRIDTPSNIGHPATLNAPSNMGIPTKINTRSNAATPMTNVDTRVDFNSSTEAHASSDIGDDDHMEVDTAMDTQKPEEDGTPSGGNPVTDHYIANDKPFEDDGRSTGGDTLVKGLEPNSVGHDDLRHSFREERPLAVFDMKTTSKNVVLTPAAISVRLLSAPNLRSNSPMLSTRQIDTLSAPQQATHPAASLAQPFVEPSRQYRAPTILSDFARSVLIDGTRPAKVAADEGMLERMSRELHHENLPYIMRREETTREDYRNSPYVPLNPLVTTEQGDKTLPELYAETRGMSPSPWAEDFYGVIERRTFADFLGVHSANPHAAKSSYELHGNDFRYLERQGLLPDVTGYENQIKSKNPVGEIVVTTDDDAMDVDDEPHTHGLNYVHVAADAIDVDDEDSESSEPDDTLSRLRTKARPRSPPSEAIIAQEPLVEEAMEAIEENLGQDGKASEQAALNYFKTVKPGRSIIAPADNEDSVLVKTGSAAPVSSSKVEVRIPRVRKMMATNLGQTTTATRGNDDEEESGSDFDPTADSDEDQKPKRTRKDTRTNRKKRKADEIEPTPEDPPEEDAEEEPANKRLKNYPYNDVRKNIVKVVSFSGFRFDRQTRQVQSKGTTTRTPTRTPAKTPARQTKKTPATTSSRKKAAAAAVPDADTGAETVTPRETRRTTKQKEEEVKKANVKNRLRGANR